MRDRRTVPSNIHFTASPSVVVISMLLFLRTVHLPTGSGKEYSEGFMALKSMFMASEWSNSPGVAMLICCCSAAVNLSFTGQNAVRVKADDMISSASLSLIFSIMGLKVMYVCGSLREHDAVVYASRLGTVVACREEVAAACVGADAAHRDMV